MPVIQIRALPQQPGVDVTDTMKRACAAVAEIMKAPPTSVWATWQPLEPGWFVEGSKDAAQQPRATHPPIVNLLAFEGRTDEQIERALETLAQILCEGLRLEPGNVFISFTEAASGRLYTGGRIRRRV